MVPSHDTVDFSSHRSMAFVGWRETRLKFSHGVLHSTADDKLGEVYQKVCILKGVFFDKKIQLGAVMEGGGGHQRARQDCLALLVAAHAERGRHSSCLPPARSRRRGGVTRAG